MATNLITLHAGSNNPFERARCTLITALARMPVPGAIGSYPISEDFEAARDHLREAAAIFDAWLGSIGHQVTENTSASIDQRAFEGAFTGAIEGEATWQCEKAAETLRSERRVA